MQQLPTYQCREALQEINVRAAIAALAACFVNVSAVTDIANEAIPCRLTLFQLTDIFNREVNAALCSLEIGGAVDCARPWNCDFLLITTGSTFDHNLMIYDPFAKGFELVDLQTASFDIWFNVSQDTSAHPMSFLSAVNCPVLTSVGGTISCVLQVALLSFLTPLLETVGVDLNINSNTHLTTLDFSSLVSVGGDLNVGAMLNTSILFPVLTTVGGNMSVGGNVVAAVDISALTSFSGNFDCSDSALPASQVNAILIKLDGLGLTSKTVALNAGTNAAPTGAGITAKANLIGRGCTVTTN